MMKQNTQVRDGRLALATLYIIILKMGHGLQEVLLRIMQGEMLVDRTQVTVILAVPLL